LNTKKDGGYRLPTEAEWEYACRGGTIFSYSFGRSISKLDANYDSTSISKVGMYKPNAFGLYDMHGNVWEWCNDWYGPYWIGSSPTGARTDPIGPTNGERRVLRGGAFIYGELYSRSSCRYDFKPSQGFNYLGFRLARTN
jgi:formylglycine-generating enzyme required for sulfatase activity